VHLSVGDDDLVDSDIAIGEPSEQQVSASVPGQTCACNWFFHLVHLVGVQWGGGDLDDVFLGGEIPDLDSLVGTDDQPILLGGEQDTVDAGVNISGSEELAFYEVPNHSEAVFSS